MWFMKEMVNHFPKYFYMNRKGFAESYFMIILLYLAALSAVIMGNDQKKVKTWMNIRKANEYLIVENKVIQDYRCRLVQGDCSEGSFSAGDIHYEASMNGNRIYLSVKGSYEEELILYFDEESGFIMDYDASRHVKAEE